MARADTSTLIPLDRVAFHLGINPWHFNSIYWTNNPYVDACPDDWYQYNWQASGKLSREALAQAVQQAEQRAEEFLHWSPVPKWYSDTVLIPDYYKAEFFNLRNSRFLSKSVLANRGYVFELGAKASTFVAQPAAVLSDPDGDGFKELVTITFNTTVTEEEELHVYYPGKSGADNWEIRPLLSVTIAAGVATITFPKYLIALEILLDEIPDPDDHHLGIDGTVDANFLQAVDVYRVYTDTSDQATIYYEPLLNCTSDCDYTTDTGCLFVRDDRLGILAYNKATWDTSSYTIESFSSIPSKVKINYRAGWRDTSLAFPTHQMNRTYERLIVYYALSLLDLELCGCDNTRNIWQWMTRDYAKDDGKVRYSMPWGKMGNPFGTSFGAVQLWEALQPLKLNRPARVF